jgi:hypothetical protein
MFIEAATLILQTQLGSTSLIQRRMKLGYNRAGRIMDQLEEFGVVGHSQGSKAREVKVRSSEELNSILDKIYNGETGNRDDFYETNKFEIDKKIEDYKEEFRRKNEENEEFLEELHTGVHYMN